MKTEDELRSEIKKLRGKINHLEFINAFSPELIECGQYKDWKLVKKYGDPVELPEQYTIILLKK